MNTYRYSSITISALFVLANVLPAGMTLAQEDTDTAPATAQQQNVREQRKAAEQRKEDVQKRAQEGKAKVEEKRGNVLERKEKTRERAAEAKASVEKRREQLTEKKAEVEQRLAERRVKVQEKREELTKRKEELEKRWQERKAKLSEKRKEIIQRHVELMVKRAQATIDRLDKIADNIATRTEKLASRGADATNAKTNLEKARQAIIDAQAALDQTKTELDAVVSAANPGEAYGQARVLFEDVRAAVGEAKQALVDAVISLKGLSGVSATPSEEPTGTSTQE